tara:strand:- start:557 stop:673 length:117 start_codon:yes stop_codon:yes gene_type:complete
MEITDVVGQEMLDLIGVLGELTDEELEELVQCMTVGLS